MALRDSDGLLMRDADGKIVRQFLIDNVATSGDWIITERNPAIRGKSYRIVDYADGLIPGCSECGETGYVVWDGVFQIAAAGPPYRWLWQVNNFGRYQMDGCRLYETKLGLFPGTHGIIYPQPFTYPMDFAWLIDIEVYHLGNKIVWGGYKQFCCDTPAGTYQMVTQDACVAPDSGPTTLEIEEVP